MRRVLYDSRLKYDEPGKSTFVCRVPNPDNTFSVMHSGLGNTNESCMTPVSKENAKKDLNKVGTRFEKQLQEITTSEKLPREQLGNSKEVMSIMLG